MLSWPIWNSHIEDFVAIHKITSQDFSALKAPRKVQKSPFSHPFAFWHLRMEPNILLKLVAHSTMVLLLSKPQFEPLIDGNPSLQPMEYVGFIDPFGSFVRGAP